ncbi:MAG TPA: hypothetical protein VER58_08655 [Thermoanaerobaculia bacterium]|nr:hypothetical protein [Thermoanaerobaculia bacterium]
MPRRKRRVVSPANAVRLVEFLIAEGKLAAHQIAQFLRIAELEKRLKALRGGGEVPVPHGRVKSRARGKNRPRRAVSAEVVATRKIQGRYIAYLRKFPKTARAKYQKIARTRSREEAIAAMNKALAKL